MSNIKIKRDVYLFELKRAYDHHKTAWTKHQENIEKYRETFNDPTRKEKMLKEILKAGHLDDITFQRYGRTTVTATFNVPEAFEQKYSFNYNAYSGPSEWQLEEMLRAIRLLELSDSEYVNASVQKMCSQFLLG